MTRILHVIQTLTTGGGGRALAGVAKYSARLGDFQHRVVSLNPVGPPGAQLAREEGLTLVNAPDPVTLKRELEQADIVHLHFWNNPEAYNFLRSDLPPMRVLIWFHIAGDHPPQILIPELVDVADFALACSPYTYEQPAFQRLSPEERARKTGMAYGATDFARLTNLQPRTHPNFNVGYIGTLDFVKMHPRYVAMSAAIEIPNVRFVVCGDGIVNILRQQARQAGAADRFDFRGYVQDIRQVLEILDVYGYPLCEDTYAAAELNLQEAMYAGIPPVVFPYGGVKRLVEHGETGLIVQSEAEYKQAIERLYRQPEERARLGRQAAEYARRVFGSENAARVVNPIYERMLQNPKRTRSWGVASGGSLLTETVSLESMMAPSAPASPAQLFVESLGSFGEPFRRSMNAQASMAELSEADQVIARASALLRSGASGGILHYRIHYSNDPYLRFWTGLVLAHDGNFTQAASEYAAATVFGFDHWRAMWYLALALERNGDSAGATAMLNKVIELAPDFAEAREARQRLSRPAAGPDEASNAAARAERLALAGDLAGAATAFDEATRLAPKRVDLWLAQAELSLRRADFARATQQFQRAAELRPDDPGIFAKVAAASVQAGEVEVFEGAISRALKLDPNHREALKVLAELNFAHGSLQDAARTYGKLLHQTPDDPEVLVKMGVCFARLNDRKTAQLVFQRLLELDPKHAEANAEYLALTGAPWKPAARTAPAASAIVSPAIVSPAVWPKISIVTPSFQQAAFLEEAIQSVLDQGYPNLEYVIMDGGSLDGSVEIIKKYARHLTYWQSRPDAGMYAALRDGFRRTTGEIMTWLNADDRLFPGSLQTAASVFARHPEARWLHGTPCTIDERSREIVPVPHGADKPWRRELYLSKDYRFIQQEGVFWRRDLWEEAGGTMRADLELAGDLELWARFFRFAQLQRVNVAFAGYRRHPGQKTAGAIGEYCREAERVLDQEIELFRQAKGQTLPGAPEILRLGPDDVRPLELNVRVSELFSTLEQAVGAGRWPAALAAARRFSAAYPNVLESLLVEAELAGRADNLVDAKAALLNCVSRFGESAAAAPGWAELAPLAKVAKLRSKLCDAPSIPSTVSPVSPAPASAPPATPFFRLGERQAPQMPDLGAMLRVESVGTSAAGGRPAPMDRKVVELVSRADDCYAKGDYRGARDALQSAVAASPTNPDLLISLGAMLFQLGDYAAARERFLQATLLQPNQPSLYVQLAICNVRLNRVDEFETALEQALALDPDYREALKLLGDLNLQEGRLKDAAQSYTRILRRNPDDVEVILPLGVCFFKSGDLETAKVIYERVLTLAPDNPLAKDNLAVVVGKLAERDAGVAAAPSPAPPAPRRTSLTLEQLLEQASFFDDAGNREAALETLKDAVDLAPRDPEVLAAKGSLHFTLGEFEAARECFRRVIELRPRDADAYTRLAMVCLKLGRIEEFEAAIGLALEIEPDNREALKFLAKTNLENERVRDAGRAYAKLLEKDPNNVEVLLSLGVCFYRGADIDSAQMVYERVLEIDPANVTAQENLLQIERRRATGKGVAPLSGAPSAEKAIDLRQLVFNAGSAIDAQEMDRAKELLRKALERPTQDTELLSALGGMLFRVGELGAARDVLLQLTRCAPDVASSWTQLAMAHLHLNEVREFETALGRALEIEPHNLEALRLLANLNFEHGSLLDAAHVYGKILHQTPDDLETLLALGVCFFKLGDAESAVVVFERAAELHPENTTARDNLNVTREKLHGSAPAATGGGRLPQLEKLLEEADALSAAGDLAGAIARLELALPMAPTRAEIPAALGNLLFKKGDIAASRERWLKAVELRPDSAEYQTCLALCCVKLELPAEFESALGRALQLEPEFRPALKLLADLNLQAGKFKDAAHAYHRVLKQTPDDVEILLPLGFCFYKVGDNETARLMFRRILELQPGHDVARENLRAVEAALKPAIQFENVEPLVSAIVSTYKSEKFMAGCLADLEAQTIAGKLEIIVVDSGSPQNERAIVEEFQQRYGNIVYIRTEERETVYAAWNRGIRAARGKYLTNANTDDRHRKDALEIMARTLDENPKITLVYADVNITEQENQTFDTAVVKDKYVWFEFDRVKLARHGCFVGPQPMWRREAHEEHGYFDPAFVSSGDYEFWMRLAKTREFLHIKQILGVYLSSPASVEHANQARAAEETELAWSRHSTDLLRKAGFSDAAISQASPPGKFKLEVPPAGRVGSLQAAHEQLKQKNYLKAWNACLSAIALRGFHPDAYLQMIDIALEAGDERQALRASERLYQMTPHWAMAKNVYNSLNGQKGHKRTKIKWTPLPAIPKRPRLSVCLIAKNEERFIGQCLASIKPIASQIIVVDTGSTDRTVEIAKEHGAEVYHFPWNDHFSDARNAAHEHARGDWVLILDADEEMPAESHARLWEDLAATNVLGYRIPIANQHESTDGVTYVPRLFRNAPALFFVGRVHEQIYASVIARMTEWGMEAKLGTATILHHGYDPAIVKSRQKVQRNLRLLELAVTELPDEPALLMNFGLDLVNDGRLEEGLEKYRKAVRLIEPHAAGSILPEVRERLLTIFGAHLLKGGYFLELLRLMTSRLAADSGPTASMSFMAALSLMKLGRAPEAIPHLRLCLERRTLATLTPPCREILREGPHHLLAECLASAGHPKEAEAQYNRALELEPRAAGVAHDLALFLHRQGRTQDSLQVLARARAAGIMNERLWQLGSFVVNSAPELQEVALEWTDEAARACPEHGSILLMRGEALLKGDRPAEALAVMEKAATVTESSPQASMLLCRLVCDVPITALAPELEPRVGQEALAWYRRLEATKALKTIGGIMARLETLRRHSPTSARLIEGAIRGE